MRAEAIFHIEEPGFESIRLFTAFFKFRFVGDIFLLLWSVTVPNFRNWLCTSENLFHANNFVSFYLLWRTCSWIFKLKPDCICSLRVRLESNDLSFAAFSIGGLWIWSGLALQDAGFYFTVANKLHGFQYHFLLHS